MAIKHIDAIWTVLKTEPHGAFSRREIQTLTGYNWNTVEATLEWLVKDGKARKLIGSILKYQAT